ncbi:hypothetical protein [Cellulomonas sp. Leaf334]|uniref:hypothetical protein n=1 Tax=Cellulomonas sp. Leaf334 TaxID=1736339 RepID=UPI000B320FD0|nr:hypothetical protein [Cellulomonas sp. Leaf334]
MPVFSGKVDVVRTPQPNEVFDPEIGGGVSALIRLDGDTADIVAGGNGVDGDVKLRSGASDITVHLDGNSATLFIGGSGRSGDIFVFRASGDDINDVQQASIHIDGDAGDIKLFNADFAEEFAFDNNECGPGTVMILDEDPGRLTMSRLAYDRRVAGVVSGASDLAPAIVLDHRGDAKMDRAAVAMAGKVYCKVDADVSPVQIGDLLTSSSTPGHAMAALDYSRAFGSVIGKALEPLPEGRGLVQILVALQ